MGKESLYISFVIAIGTGVGIFLNAVNPIALYALIQVNYLVERGFLYQLITSIVITPSLTDGFFNVLSMLVIYRIFGSYAGKKEYLVFLVSGILGNIVSLLQGPYVSSAGASGGIFGVLAYYVLDSFRAERNLSKWLAEGYLILLAIVFVISDLIPGVDVLAHVGGTLAGFLLSFISPVKAVRSDEKR